MLARRFKPVRTALFCFFISMAVGQASPAQLEPDDLNGLWQLQNSLDAIVRITQTGKSVEGVWLSVPPEARTTREFKPGDWFLRASWEGAGWQGEVHTRFRLHYKTLCPNTWDRAAEVELKLRPGGDTLEGQYQSRDIREDCSITEGAVKPVALLRIREGLELSGYWRVTSGKAAGWLMRGRTFAGGACRPGHRPGCSHRNDLVRDEQRSSRKSIRSRTL